MKNFQDFKIPDISSENIKEGSEYDVAYWIASELVKTGLARFHEESIMNAITLNKIHWRETKLQTGRQISYLPNLFYPLIRRYMRLLKEKSALDSSIVNEYNNALRLIHDVIDCRLKKIVGLATSSTQTEDVLKSLSNEERQLYDYLNDAILRWKSNIFKVEE